MASRIGDVLVKQGLISDSQLAQATEAAQQNGGMVGSSLVKLGFVDEDILVSTLSTQYGLPVVQIDDHSVQAEVLNLIPHAIASKYLLLPLEVTGNTLTVAMVDPSNITAVNDIKFITGHDIRVVLAPESEVRGGIEKCYESSVSYDSIFEDMDDSANVEVLNTEQELDLDSLERQTEDAPVVKLVNAILTDAIKKGASDIHIEPYEKVFRVRFRIDGVL